MKDFVQRTFLYFERHRTSLRVSLCAVIALMVVAVGRVHFVEDISKFLPEDVAGERMGDFFQRLSASNQVMVSGLLAYPAPKSAGACRG